MNIAVVKETFPGEQRVALVPSALAPLLKAGMEVLVETGAGEAAGFSDAEYEQKGATVVSSRADAFAADIILQVRSLGANQEAGRADLASMRSGATLIGMCDPLGEPTAIAEVAATGITQFALELVPRTTRAQAMDVLSSMATIAGYRAVLLAASESPKIFPMLTYAAGMLRPSHVFVLGVGVAGLRAIATAKMLGAVVYAHDIRPNSREEVESVGAKFIELEFGAEDSQDAGGYAKQMGEDFYQAQRKLIAEKAAECDVLITTAAIPGRRSPLLVTADAVKGMAAGSVIVDLAAERGGNCELTVADQRIVQHGVTLLGPTNLPSEIPQDASQMFASNCVKFLLNLVKEGTLAMDLDDDIICNTLVARDGEVVHPRIRELLKLGPMEPSAENLPAEPEE